MDNIETFVDPATLTGAEFAKYLGKTAIISSTVTVGMLTGILTVSLAYGALKDRQDKRKAAEKSETPVEETK